MKRVKLWVFDVWRPTTMLIVGLLLAGFIYGSHIGDLTHGTSMQETNYIGSVSSGKDLLNHPMYAMHKIPVYMLFKLHVHSIAFYRAISACFMTLAVVACFFILREWYSNRIAVLGAWLFATSAWMLHVGRLATPEASFLLMMPLLWAAVWLYNTTLRKTALLVLSLLIGMSFYIPGFGWLLIASGIWQRKVIIKELEDVDVWFKIYCLAIIGILLIPLIWASVLHPSELLLAGGLPSKFPTPKLIAKQIIKIPMYLLFRGPADPSHWLGRLPLLDLFSSAMLILGLYSMRYHLKLIRIQLLVGTSAFMAFLIALGGPITITVLMPAVYLTIAGGVAFMLQQWFVVFPRNPIAQTIATTLVSVCILLASFYHVSHYFIAWPQAPATKSAFTQHLVQ